MADNEHKDLEKRTSFREIINLISLTGFVYGPLDDRLSIREALEKNLKKPVPDHVNWLFCFGGVTFLLFIVQAFTGVLLLMYYQPTTAEAYKSVVHITNNVPFGWLMRGIHHWAANLMSVFCLLHMLRVFFYGAYKAPRDFNWVTGVMLLCVTLGFGFTGYLLPWNQISYWATTVGTEVPSAMPVAGDLIKMLIRGGSDISQATLTRFFAIHVLILPAAIAVFLISHFLMIRRQGISEAL
ncbi:MAG: cytochrome b N-terminal domain-containing protein [Candidatus Schekmanbacteria bacterium]|nr:cytochrome b N-terminal domain-containing protein [Candidatus Schekmanbacteria bacterium]